ncbi:hypothetical protein [Halobacillus karajensis]|uniref:Uncharacterized protein n=1 Tax=Halobacillus karajensis TaxID=195088 RepID=A0A024PAF6_9BACI|nr:hypothetical protein [Halobacillus karajensis]CDQ21807.1 hypothetical protein BN982_04237 [Halobacillus karajensis]CDQ25803.1 hypothetical protein BN983_04184 [Halobacillus karajensis]CDQ28935.1 hypothetical protein BN981_03253 [Halobacillus karajensis]
MTKQTKSAKEVMDLIQEMDNAERWKLLNELYYKHYSSPEEKYTEIAMDY